jgi:ribosome-associated protein
MDAARSELGDGDPVPDAAAEAATQRKGEVTTISLTTARPRRKAAQRPALLALALKTLEDGQAEQPVVLDLAGKSSIADHMIIASGRSQRQVVALAERLVATLKERGYPRPETEGLPLADWVLIDAGDLLIHLFRPEVREHYNLEKMWGAMLPEAAAQ